MHVQDGGAIMENEKICKECGKPFIPTKKRQKYCDRIHYRPCPSCGKQIEIKWLSNPTPRCDDCRKHRSITVGNDKESTSAFKFNYSSAEYVERKYTGKTSCGFITDHVYVVGLVKNDPYGYVAHALEDRTTGDDVSVDLLLSSEISWKHFFCEV